MGSKDNGECIINTKLPAGRWTSEGVVSGNKAGAEYECEESERERPAGTGLEQDRSETKTGLERDENGNAMS